MVQIKALFNKLICSEQPVVSYEDYEPLNTCMETTVVSSHRSLRIDY